MRPDLGQLSNLSSHQALPCSDSSHEGFSQVPTVPVTAGTSQAIPLPGALQTYSALLTPAQPLDLNPMSLLRDGLP